MRENYTYKSVKGTRDVFPEEARRYQWLENTARNFFARCGCGEIRTPLLEPTRLFERGVGEGTDIVNKEMFYVPAKDEEAGPEALRRMVLRPEATASVARAYVEHEIAKTAPGVQKYYYIGPMFRYERPQKGRLRQFTQIGVEMLGSAEPGMDAEAVCLLHDYLAEFKLPKLTLLLNSVGCDQCRPAYSQQLRAFVRERLAALCPDCQQRGERNPLRLFDCKVAACRRILEEAPRIQDFLCPDCRAHQDRLLALLAEADIPYQLEPRLVRGLDYYTRTVFEMVSENLGAQNAVAAGGRYDHLVQDLEGPATPAIGWSLGVERLLELWAGPAAAGLFDLFVVDPGPDAKRIFRQVLAWRRSGLRVGVEYEGRSPKALMKRADKLGSRFALFVTAGEPERVELKNLRTGEQIKVRWEEVGEKVRI